MLGLCTLGHWFLSFALVLANGHAVEASVGRLDISVDGSVLVGDTLGALGIASSHLPVPTGAGVIRLAGAISNLESTVRGVGVKRISL